MITSVLLFLVVSGGALEIYLVSRPADVNMFSFFCSQNVDMFALALTTA